MRLHRFVHQELPQSQFHISEIFRLNYLYVESNRYSIRKHNFPNGSINRANEIVDAARSVVRWSVIFYTLCELQRWNVDRILIMAIEASDCHYLFNTMGLVFHWLGTEELFSEKLEIILKCAMSIFTRANIFQTTSVSYRRPRRLVLIISFNLKWKFLRSFFWIAILSICLSVKC